ncbi:Rieske 2Fe-2S domain-containing protein [Kitasatospora sp. NPDC094011]|uniref:Rieske 2Fe-2S domain-containing protein n=1 Tax=Kitasatospora sp. NPDC094011 TaxID=3364090 RepID=UPI0037FDFFCD
MHPPTPAQPNPREPALPYPSGWFALGFSRELPPATVLTRRFMGEDVVLYRTRAGLLRAVHPYCPHLGAHLGAGGTVAAENLVCPFHGFAFSPDGTCVHAPAGRPPRAPVSHHPVREVGGIVFLWHGQTAPTWELPAVSEDGFSPLRHRGLLLPTHPQEIAENSVDYGHFGPVHRLPRPQETAPPAADGPLYRVNVRITFKKLPLLGEFGVPQTILLFGLGGILFEIPYPRLGLRVRSWGLITPVGPWQTRLEIAIATSVEGRGPLPGPLRKAAAELVSQAVLAVEMKSTGPDLEIWSHKRYQHHPRIASGDGPIGKYRHWAQQFYPPETVAPHPGQSGVSDAAP